ncbi:MAG: hypothetical protein IT438_10215 [Phycisphaerales bacterium]|nr:hypothetical protein [Phycisphaerales bacterium]
MKRPRPIAFPVAIAAAYAALYLAWSSGSLRRLTADAYFAVLCVLGPSRPQRLGPLRYALDDHRYVIIDTCTPWFICLAGFALLALARVSPVRYLAACAIFFGAALAAMCLNNAVSMWIRPLVGWHLAHRPGLTSIYIIAYLACLLYILRTRHARSCISPQPHERAALPGSA